MVQMEVFPFKFSIFLLKNLIIWVGSNLSIHWKKPFMTLLGHSSEQHATKYQKYVPESVVPPEKQELRRGVSHFLPSVLFCMYKNVVSFFQVLSLLIVFCLFGNWVGVSTYLHLMWFTRSDPFIMLRRILRNSWKVLTSKQENTFRVG